MENYLHASSSKPRGRPPGSKNKRIEPKPSANVQQDGVGMQTKVLEVAAGADIIKAVSDFANRLNVDVSVVSTYGLVKNLTIYRSQPSLLYPIILNFDGVFDLLSLKAIFHGCFATRPPPGYESRYIYFLDGEGIATGGTLAGGLLAASKVFLVVSFMNETGRKEPPLASARQPEVGSSARGSVGFYRVPSPTPPSRPEVGSSARGSMGFYCVPSPTPPLRPDVGSSARGSMGFNYVPSPTPPLRPEVGSSAGGSMGSYCAPSPTRPSRPCIHDANGYLCAYGFK